MESRLSFGVLSVTLFSVFSSVPAQAATYTFNGKPFTVQGHRGARGLVGPGNTFADLQAAIDVSVDSLEVDLRRTRDRVIVLGHDENLSLTCRYTGPGRPSTHRISQMTFAEQQRWDCEPQTQGVQPYPTLRQLLNYHQADNFLFNLEIKPDDIDTTNQIMKEVVLYNQSCHNCLAGRLRISSFAWNVLRYARREYKSRIPFSIAALSIFSFGSTIRKASQFADVFSPSYKFINANTVRSVHRAGMKIIPYTVNRLRDLNRILNLGVDGIITDYPNILADLVNRVHLPQTAVELSTVNGL